MNPNTKGTQSVGRPALSILSKIGFLVIGMFLAFCVAEIVLRVRETPPLPHLEKVSDPTLIYRHIPSFSYKQPGWNVHYNSLGLRAPEVGPKDSGRKRILFIGDSIIEGVGARDDSHTAPVFVEKSLAARGIPAESLNAGVSGYNASQIRRNLEILLPIIKPDLVVYGFSLNDILRLAEVDSAGRFRSESLSFTQLLRRSRFVIQTGHFVQTFFIRRNLKPPIGDYSSYCRRVLNMYVPGEAWDKLVWELERMVALAREESVPFAAVLYPLATQFMGDPRTALDDVAGILGRNGSSVIDVGSFMSEKGGSSLYLMNDPVHLTPEAHALLAEVIADHLAPLLMSPHAALPSGSMPE
jgi:lysophospholipase L1-like esterase